MTTGSEASPAVGKDMVLGDLAHNWGWLLALGILLVILGTIGLGMTLALTLATVFVFGVFLVVGGGVQIVQTLKCRGWKSIMLHVLIAVLYLLAGLIIIADPLMASSVLTLLLAGAFIGTGIVRTIMALQFRGFKNWIWPLIGGIAAMLLGLMIYARWPVSGLWIIGFFVALELIFSGWSYIFIALGARQFGKAA